MPNQSTFRAIACCGSLQWPTKLLSICMKMHAIFLTTFGTSSECTRTPCIEPNSVTFSFLFLSIYYFYSSSTTAERQTFHFQCETHASIHVPMKIILEHTFWLCLVWKRWSCELVTRRTYATDKRYDNDKLFVVLHRLKRQKKLRDCESEQNNEKTLNDDGLSSSVDVKNKMKKIFND